MTNHREMTSKVSHWLDPRNNKVQYALVPVYARPAIKKQYKRLSIEFMKRPDMASIIRSST